MQVKNFSISADVDTITDEALKVKQIVESHGMSYRNGVVQKRGSNWYNWFSHKYVCYICTLSLTLKKVVVECYEINHDTLIVAEAVKRAYGKEVELKLKVERCFYG